MPRLQRRSKVISIRLSREEYDQFQDLCVARGNDTLSELARTAMKLLVPNENGNGKAASEKRFSSMESRISILENEIARLSGLICVAKLEECQ